MDYLFPIILSLHILVGLSVIGLVLLQHGKGADMGAAFGSGSAGSLFGATGSANFLSRSTAVAAAVFFVTSLTLTYLYAHPAQAHGVMDRADLSKVAPTKAAPQPVGGEAPAAQSKETPK